jgi:hypothetical protein
VSLGKGEDNDGVENGETKMKMKHKINGGKARAD